MDANAHSTDALAVRRPTLRGRDVCTRCLRAASACICSWVRPVNHAVEVVILQHPLEVHEAKGSARLLHLSLPNSRLLLGEVFDEAAVFSLSGAPKRNLLLYPATPSPGLQAPLSLVQASEVSDRSGVRLVVLDATWRKSRKMLHLNGWLQRLPRLQLEEVPASRYLIRRAHKPGQLSTLEATCAALVQMECADGGQAAPGKAAFESLLDAFDGFVAQQLALREDGFHRRITNAE